MLRTSFVIVALVAAGLSIAPATPATASIEAANGDGEIIPGSWIVILRPGHKPAESWDIASDNGGRARYVYYWALRGFNFVGTQAEKDQLARDPRVLRIEPDRTVRAQNVEPGVERIGATNADGPSVGDAHAAGFRGAGARIAILDTGVSPNHPDLNVDAAAGKNCTSQSLGSGGNHGSNVAGIAAASGGITGVAPDATIIGVKVLTDSGGGSWSSIQCGIDHVTAINNDGNPANDISVMNMSLGGGSSYQTGDPCSQLAIRQAICNAYNSLESQKVVILAAAGNERSNTAGFAPANYPEVIGVSSLTEFDGEVGTAGGCKAVGSQTDCDGTFAWYSNRGSEAELIAPGSLVRSTGAGTGYFTLSGTSQSSPHVAGVAALMRAVNPTLPEPTLRSLLKSTGECPNGQTNGADGPCSGKGAWPDDTDGIAEPLVNALRAAQAAGGGSPPPTNTAPSAQFFSPPAGNVSGTVTVQFDGSDAETTNESQLTGWWSLNGGSSWTQATYNSSTGHFEAPAWNTTADANGTSRTYTIEVRDPGGLASTNQARTFTVQNSASNTAPTAAFFAPAAGNVSGTVTVQFDGSDAQSSESQLTGWWSLNGGSSFTQATYNSSTGHFEAPAWNTTADANGTSRTYTIQVRDPGGLVSANVARTFTVQNGTTQTWTRFQESSSSVAYSGSTQSVSSSSASGGTYRRLLTTGTTATFSFTGTGVRFIGTRATNGGILEVLLDGASVGTIDQYGSSLQWQLQQFERTGLSNAAHTLQIRVTGNRNPSSSDIRGFVDAFEALGSGSPPPPPPTETWTRVQESSSSVAYSGSTQSVSSSSASGGTYRRLLTTGTTATFSFTGTGVRFIGTRATNGGILEVLLDGVVVGTIDQYGSSLQWQLQQFERTGLSNAAHTLQIRVTGNRNPSSSDIRGFVDAFEFFS